VTVQRICAQHGRYVGRDCPKCRSVRAARPKPRTRAVAVRSSARWKNVAAAAAKRDGHRCTYGLEDGDRGARTYPGGRCPVQDGLTGHHRTPIEDGGAPYDLANVRTLCATHHARLEAEARTHRREETSEPA
jgi:5-methylcytosine-specific restriction endonuclease McrA